MRRIKTILLKQKLFIFFALSGIFISGLHAQNGLGSLEFIENKGQWDSTIRYRADMPNSTFFLQKHGFSVLLQSPADMEALRQLLHGVPSAVKTPVKTDKSSTSKKTEQTSTLTANIPPVQEYPLIPHE